MLNENAKKWVEALRSDEYKQGKNALRTTADGRCCLGVACDLYRKEHPEVDWEWKLLEGIFSDGETRAWNFMDANGGLPLKVMEWLGINEELGSFDEAIEGNEEDNEFYATALSELNDEADWDFNQIADFVESEPKGLFHD